MWVVLSTKLVVICYSSFRKRIQQTSDALEGGLFCRFSNSLGTAKGCWQEWECSWSLAPIHLGPGWPYHHTGQTGQGERGSERPQEGAWHLEDRVGSDSQELSTLSSGPTITFYRWRNWGSEKGSRVTCDGADLAEKNTWIPEVLGGTSRRWGGAGFLHRVGSLRRGGAAPSARGGGWILPPFDHLLCVSGASFTLLSLVSFYQGFNNHLST